MKPSFNKKMNKLQFLNFKTLSLNKSIYKIDTDLLFDFKYFFILNNFVNYYNL